MEITHDPDPEGFVTYARHIQQTGTLMEHRRPPGYPFLLAWVDRVGPGTMHEDALQFHRAVVFICILGMVLWVQRNFGHLVAILFFSMFAIGGNYFVWISSMMMSDLFLSLWFIGYIWAGWKTFKEKSPCWGYLLLGCLFIFGGQAFHSSFCVRACIYTVSTALCLIIGILIKKKEGKAEVMKKTMLLLISAWATAYWGESLLSIKVEKSNYVNLDNWEKSQNNFISYWLTISQLASLPPPKKPTDLDLKIEEAKVNASKILGYNIQSKKIPSIGGPYSAYGAVFSDNQVPLNFWWQRLWDNPLCFIMPFLHEIKYSYHRFFDDISPFEPISKRTFNILKLPPQTNETYSRVFWKYGLNYTSLACKKKENQLIEIFLDTTKKIIWIYLSFIGFLEISKITKLTNAIGISLIIWIFISINVSAAETRYILPYLPFINLTIVLGLVKYQKIIKSKIAKK